MGDFSAALELAARSLPLNSPEEIKAMRDLLDKVVTNIEAHPYEIKFRTLKLSNKILRAKVFDRTGAKEVMRVLGFRRTALSESMEAAMILAFDEGEEEEAANLETAAAGSSSAVAVREAWTWLSSQLEACLEMGGAAKRGTTCCAECALQLRLPGGSSIKAGFYAEEPLSAVADFVAAYRPLTQAPSGGGGDGDSDGGGGGGDGPRRLQWVLSTTHPRVVYAEPGQLAASLRSLGLVPRAALVAVPSSGALSAEQLRSQQQEAAAASLKQAHDEDVAARRARETALRTAKARKVEEERRARARVVGDFHADRAEARDRQAAAAHAKALHAAQAAAEAQDAEMAAAAARRQLETGVEGASPLPPIPPLPPSPAEGKVAIRGQAGELAPECPKAGGTSERTDGTAALLVPPEVP